MRPLLIKLLWLTALCSLSHSGQAQPEPKPTDYQALSLPAELLANANEIVRFENLEVEANSDHTGVIRYHGVITILTADSKAFEQIVRYSNDSKISKLEGTLYNKLGQEIRTSSKKDIEDFALVSSGTFYQDDRIKQLRLRSSQLPYTVEFKYERKIRDIEFANLPDWYIANFGESCAYRRYQVELPLENQLYYRRLNTDIEAVITEGPKSRTYTWEATNVPAVPFERYLPSYDELIPHILVALDQFNIEGYDGSMKNWEAFGSFINELYSGRDALPADVKTDVQQLCATAETDQQKVDLLYRYMQERVRYVGVQLGLGGWQPFSAEYVAENR